MNDEQVKLNEITVTIAGYSKKGHGVANSPKPVEVIGAVRGDVILAKLLKRVRKRHQTQVLELISPSADRQEARCKHSGVCGGCKWQQIAYQSQLAEKKGAIAALFPSETVNDVIGCSDPWHYRNKMEFSFSQSKEGEKFLGLMRSNGRFRVENIHECHIAPTWMTQVLENVRVWWDGSGLDAFYPGTGEGALRTLTMRWGQNTDAKMVFLTLIGASTYSLSKTQLNNFVKAAQIDEKTAVFLVIQHTEKGKETTFSEMHLAGPSSMEEIVLDQKFSISPRAFFQPNTKMAERMFLDLIEIVKTRGGKKVLDLYCGIGTIGILLAPHVQQVIGVELNPHAICDAKEVIEESGFENIQVFCQDATNFLIETRDFFNPDTVIVDPPRCGLTNQGLEDIERLAPRTIIYVSCNPATQATDVANLSNYKIESIQPYDQFPHTIHIENIIVLTRVT